MAGGSQDSRKPASLEGYDFTERKWIKFPDLLEPRFAFNIYVIDRKAHVAGGNSARSLGALEEEADEDTEAVEALPTGTSARDAHHGGRGRQGLAVARWKEVTRLTENYSAMRSIGAITACMGPCIYFFGIDLDSTDAQPDSSMNAFPDSLRRDYYNMQT